MTKKILPKLKLTFIPCEKNHYRPKFLEGNFLIYCLVILFFLKLSTVPFYLYFPKNVFFGAIVKSELIKTLNQKRESLGLPLLKENLLLDRAAFLKANDMMKKNYFSHQSPDGLSPWYWFRAVGYNYRVAGENLAIGFLNSDEVNRSWLNSPSHRANLLSPGYEEVGIAVLRGNFQGNKTNIVVQLFGSPQAIQKSYSKEISKKGFTAFPQKTGLSEKKVEKKILGAKSEKENTGKVFPEKDARPSVPREPEEKIGFSFIYFFNSAYYEILQFLIYGFLTLIIFSLIINIFVKTNIQHPDLIFKALGFIAVLVLFILIDREAIVNFIPHTLYVY